MRDHLCVNCCLTARSVNELFSIVINFLFQFHYIVIVRYWKFWHSLFCSVRKTEQFGKHIFECGMLSIVISELLLAPDIVKFSSRRARFCNIWTGQYCTFAKDKDSGDIYAWGLNNYYQLGQIAFLMTSLQWASQTGHALRTCLGRTLVPNLVLVLYAV